MTPSDDAQPESTSAKEALTGGGVSLEQVVGRYLAELAEGRSPDRQAYLAEHAELSEALRGIFKTLDFVEATSKSLTTVPFQYGQRLGEYRIVRELARGGMGVVYEAIQTSLNRRVALKVLPTGALFSDNAATRFAREALTAARLHHTNIVPVYAVGEEQGVHFYVMQYIEGHSLSEHLKRLRQSGTRVDSAYCARVARWGQQVAEALAYAHGEGVLHRDIKPSNLLVDARDNVWVTDFGLARADTQTTLTVTGDVLGTARYMSPEQARGGRSRVDGRTDIYSLGASVYELLALAPAFDGESREDVLSQVMFIEPPPLRRRNRTIPRDLETIVAKCMQKDPQHRYGHAADVAEDCRRYLAGGSIRARRTPFVVKAARFVRRHRLHAVGSLVALALAATTLLLVVQARRNQGRQRVEAAFSVMLFERDARRAVRLLDEAESLGDRSAELYLCRGLTNLMFGRPQRAVAPLEESLRRDPGQVETALALACVHRSLGDETLGQRYLARHAPEEIHTALGWLLRGLALEYDEGSEAVEAFDRAVALRPDFIPAIEVRAFWRAHRVLLGGQRSELDPMLHDFEAWVVFRPTSARAYGSRAIGRLNAAAYAAGQPDLRAESEQWLAGCRADLAQALALRAPDDFATFVRQGGYLQYIGDFRGMADAFARAIEVDQANAGDTHPGFVHYRVLALHALGELGPALQEVVPASAALPNFWPLEIQRALLLAELGHPGEAQAVGRECLGRHRDDAVYIAAFLELLGDRDAAAGAIRSQGAGRPPPTSALERPAAADNPLLDYLAGDLTGPELLAIAGEHPGQRCQHAFVIALRELGRGQRDAARSALQACLDTGVFEFVEYRFGQVFRVRMQQEPGWPAWIQKPAEP